MTTQCIILEGESLGSPLAGATQIVKQFYVHRCGHEGKPIAAAECIKQMVIDILHTHRKFTNRVFYRQGILVI